jgi:hypothetical protein
MMGREWWLDKIFHDIEAFDPRCLVISLSIPRFMLFTVQCNTPRIFSE